MATREELLDTIQRLLALSGSPNEHEARTALERAQRYMIEHNITMAEVEAAEVHGHNMEWVEEDAFEGAVASMELHFVARILRRFFFVRGITYREYDHQAGRRETRLALFGQKENVVVAKYVFVYLCRVFRDLFDHYRKETLCPLNERQSFYSGLEKGFSEKLREERRVHEQRSGSTGTALMVIDADLDRALRERYPDLQHTRQHVNVYAGSHAAGVQQGRKITLRQSVEGKGQLALGRA